MATFLSGLDILPSLQLLFFFLALLFFHSSEYFLALLIHGRRGTSLNSFLLSRQYLVAMICGLIEYGFERFFFAGIKTQIWLSLAGLVLVIIGEIMRKLAIITAEHNFTHDIKLYRRENHCLITHGIYRFVRHPSYLGFLLWSTGTQVLLCNPICTVGYAVVLWRFFSRRIRYEEYYLYQFFGREYEAYAERVPSGIPFVK